MIGKNEKGKKKRRLHANSCILDVCFAAGVSNVAVIEMAVKIWKGMLVGCVDRFEICT